MRQVFANEILNLRDFVNIQSVLKDSLNEIYLAFDIRSQKKCLIY